MPLLPLRCRAAAAMLPARAICICSGPLSCCEQAALLEPALPAEEGAPLPSLLRAS